jgi:alanine dehydrogenase
VFAWADMIVKVKEPQPQECRMLRPGQVLFTYLHLAPDPEQAQGAARQRLHRDRLRDRHRRRGGLPLLAPMSEVAGRMAMQAVRRISAAKRPTAVAACCWAACRASPAQGRA